MPIGRSRDPLQKSCGTLIPMLGRSSALPFAANSPCYCRQNGAFWLIPILGSKRSQTFAEGPWREGGDDRPRSGHAFLAGKVLPGDCPRQAEPSGKAEWPDHNVSNMYIAMLSTNFGGTSGAFCSPNPKKSPEYPQLPPGFTPPDVARPACTPPAVHDRKRQGASPNGRTTPCASSTDCRRGHSK